MDRAEAICRLFDVRIAQAELVCGEDIPCTVGFGDYEHFHTPRGYGVTFFQDGSEPHVLLSWKCLNAPPDRVDGVIRHEIGHVVDMQFDAKSLDAWARSRGVKLPPKRHAELRADAVALRIFGEPIYYDTDDVQSTEYGETPRPSHLGK